MMSRVLIANRGEIALRVLRACKAMGKQTVAVYTEVDRDLPHLALADEQVRVSHYLNAQDIVMAGLTTGCDSVHPGYGLLSENAEFAFSVEQSGMVFIGPSPEHIRLLGDKVQARKVFAKLGISPIPGSQEVCKTADEVRVLAETIGYPIVIKAAFGGGGRGIRAVADAKSLVEIFGVSQGEAEISFGKNDVFVEKLLTKARHIEIQVLGDGKGGCAHLGTRDCSVQRRYQKLVEEAPAQMLNEEALQQLLSQTLAAMSEIKYRNAATLEFLYADETFYFLEVNTRLQVEHPVTEMITGQDVVAAQFHIAETGTLPESLNEVQVQGCAIECRILAENAEGVPSPGLIENLFVPGGPGVRFDSHLYVGYRVPHQYDSLLAKLVVFADKRSSALAKMEQALVELSIGGIETNINQLLTIVRHPEFVAGQFHTDWKPYINEIP